MAGAGGVKFVAGRIPSEGIDVVQARRSRPHVRVRHCWVLRRPAEVGRCLLANDRRCLIRVIRRSGGVLRLDPDALETFSSKVVVEPYVFVLSFADVISYSVLVSTNDSRRCRREGWSMARWSKFVSTFSRSVGARTTIGRVSYFGKMR